MWVIFPHLFANVIQSLKCAARFRTAYNCNDFSASAVDPAYTGLQREGLGYQLYTITYMVKILELLVLFIVDRKEIVKKVTREDEEIEQDDYLE